MHYYIDNMTKHVDYLACEQWHKDFHFGGTDMFDINHLRDELKILSKLQSFCSNLLCGAAL